ncbi:LPS-assembly protein LptD [Flavobacterium sp. HXWNR69]|uniref:LPS-assembly protein LptD n=1 Tax=Flavobacterium fragile TaxID=2949085 RepID=A0ABT0TH57_9FLAO|nr:putative LPS assembly protein LptD [Flavobacterium sp. HXWNR69]MCL9770293.1 LPS-assembly protein LptD [Flavobacterium sp. HXWNR69]
MTLQKVSQIFTKILLKALHNKIIHIVFSVIFLTLGSHLAFSQENPALNTINLSKTDLEKVRDTSKTNTSKTNTSKADTLKKKKPFLDGVVNMKAKEYEKLDQKKKTVTLHDEAEIYYTDFELKAGRIVLDYDKDLVYAGRLKDSSGKYIQRPVFKQGSNVVEPDSIIFHTKSKRAKVWNSRTQQSDLFIKAEISKKENDSVYFMRNARMTTSKNEEDPEYYFLVKKVKFVPKKKVIINSTQMYIADVPTPIWLPYGYFPITENSASGFIMPTPGQNNQKGYFLQNGGYYFALSENYDLAVLGDYFTNGSYGLRAESSYAKRYKFNGRFNLRFENNIQSEKGFPDYTKSRQYNIQWSHSQDAKAAANSRFSASVNLGSSQYYRQSVNLNNIGSSINNNLSSSVSFSKTFQTVPQVNMSLSATHSQNTNTQQIDMTLPTFQASVDRIFPFASKDGVKKGLIKNINFQYNIRGENRIRTTDSLFFKPQMFRDARSGFQHSIPISTNFKIFKHFSISANASYNEVWTMNTIRKFFSPTANKVLTVEEKGFESFRTYNFNVGIGTTIYGTFNFGEDKKIQAIRHVIRPNISYGYTPSFDQYFERYALDASGINFSEYTKFDNGLFGAPSNSISNAMNISMSNTFEAKVKDKESKKGESKKVMLLNNLNFATRYDFTADSLKLKEITMSGGTQLFKQKMNINFAAVFDPYAIDNAGRRIEKFNIDNGGSLLRMPRANVTVNYSFSNTGSDKGKTSEQNVQNGGREDDLFGVGTDLSNNRNSLFDKDKKKKEGEENTNSQWYNTKLPWDLRIAYSMNYNNSNRQNEIASHSLMASGNIEMAPRWKLGFSSGYDFVQKGVTFTQLRFERDLESWRMSFNWVPFGTNTYWGFFVGITSSILSDIKYDKRQLPDRTFRQ